MLIILILIIILQFLYIVILHNSNDNLKYVITNNKSATKCKNTITLTNEVKMVIDDVLIKSVSNIHNHYNNNDTLCESDCMQVIDKIAQLRTVFDSSICTVQTFKLVAYIYKQSTYQRYTTRMNNDICCAINEILIKNYDENNLKSNLCESYKNLNDVRYKKLYEHGIELLTNKNIKVEYTDTIDSQVQDIIDIFNNQIKLQHNNRNRYENELSISQRYINSYK